jgi:uncharacterized coiled-coil protein SlyX
MWIGQATFTGEAFARFRSELQTTHPGKGRITMHKLLLGNSGPALRLAFLLTSVVLVCFGFPPRVQATDTESALSGNNTADGTGVLTNLTTGVWNTGIGFEALFSDTTGNTNTAGGFQALNSNTTGGANTAIGSQALLNNVSGTGNIALGANAGVNITTGSFNIDIGNAGSAADSAAIRIGRVGTQRAAFMAGIHGVPIPNSLPVVVDVNGHLGTAINISSARFKDEIKPMDKVSEAILSLKPVTFCYKNELDPTRTAQFGLVAEEVEKVNPTLVTRDSDGKPYTVRYDAINVMLLNEFLKEHHAVQELTSVSAKQEARIALQEQEIKSLTAALKEQAKQIQKVSAQVETSKPAPQVVVNQ